MRFNSQLCGELDGSSHCRLLHARSRTSLTISGLKLIAIICAIIQPLQIIRVLVFSPTLIYSVGRSSKKLRRVWPERIVFENSPRVYLGIFKLRSEGLETALLTLHPVGISGPAAVYRFFISVVRGAKLLGCIEDRLPSSLPSPHSFHRVRSFSSTGLCHQEDITALLAS